MVGVYRSAVENALADYYRKNGEVVHPGVWCSLARKEIDMELGEVCLRQKKIMNE